MSSFAGISYSESMKDNKIVNVAGIKLPTANPSQRTLTTLFDFAKLADLEREHMALICSKCGGLIPDINFNKPLSGCKNHVKSN